MFKDSRFKVGDIILIDLVVDSYFDILPRTVLILEIANRCYNYLDLATGCYSEIAIDYADVHTEQIILVA